MTSPQQGAQAKAPDHAGDYAAFVRGVERRLISYLAYSCGSMADAEDLFQEVCLKLHDEWRKVRAMERPDAWAIRVAHNLAVNRFKRRDAERRALYGVGQRELMATGGVAPAAADGTGAERDELSAAVNRALAGLPGEQRQAVCQKVWGGLGWTDIGANLGVSDDTAARLFARGLRAMEPLLRDFQPGTRS